MAQFKYTALTRDGAKVSGMIEGFNELDAAARIKEEYSVIVKLSPVKEKGPGLMNLEIGKPRLNVKAFTVMCSQFAIILKAGIPIGRAVTLIANKTTDRVLNRLLKQVASDVEGGRALSAGFEEHGAKFLPVTFIETIRAGEESGNLSGAFDSMHRHFDKQGKMSGRVRGAMAYPMFVLVLAIGVVAVLMIKVVPTFTALFDSYGATLPLMTQMLISISTFFQHYTWLLALIAGALFIFIKVYSATESGRMQIAKWGLKVPVLGEIQELNGASQFANTMTTLLEAGLPMNKAVSITARVMDNYYLSTETGKLSGKLEEGHSLGASMKEQKVLPDILVDMTAVGEDTGEMAQTLDSIGEYYDAELETAIQAALAKLEPTLLIGIAVVAGFIVISIYMAMFSLYGAM